LGIEWGQKAKVIPVEVTEQLRASHVCANVASGFRFGEMKERRLPRCSIVQPPRTTTQAEFRILR